MFRRIAIPLVVLCVAGYGTACNEPTSGGGPFEPQLAETIGSQLVECPTGTTRTTSALIGPLGGTLEVDGHRMTVPAGALLLPTEVTLTVPASQYVEVDIRAGGEEHFVFEAPVEVSISYARCSRSNIERTSLSAWYIDSETKALLEDMGGVDDKTARTVTFTTGHLSGYAIAD